MGNRYMGTDRIETTKEKNTEILSLRNEKWSYDYSFTHFFFDNKDACTVKINNSNPIYLEAGDGFQTDYYNTPINSFIIIESGVSYKWSGDRK